MNTTRGGNEWDVLTLALRICGSLNCLGQIISSYQSVNALTYNEWDIFSHFMHVIIHIFRILGLFTQLGLIFSLCLVQIISAISGGITDLSFHAVGYAWQIVNCFLTASYSVKYIT